MNVSDAPAGRGLGEIECHGGWFLLARCREAGSAGRAIGCGAGQHLELDPGLRPVLPADEGVEVELAYLIAFCRRGDVLADELRHRLHEIASSLLLRADVERLVRFLVGRVDAL